MPSKLVCKHCWIEVISIKAKSEIGRGTTYNFKHKSLKDDVGQAFCGRISLSEEDVEYANPIDEEALRQQ